MKCSQIKVRTITIRTYESLANLERTNAVRTNEMLASIVCTNEILTYGMHTNT